MYTYIQTKQKKAVLFSNNNKSSTYWIVKELWEKYEELRTAQYEEELYKVFFSFVFLLEQKFVITRYFALLSVRLGTWYSYQDGPPPLPPYKMQIAITLEFALLCSLPGMCTFFF